MSNQKIPKDKFELAYRQVQTYNDHARYASRERFKNLTNISALSATLLVVATFQDGLLEMTTCVKVLLSVLLLLIPISLLVYLYDLSKSEDKSHKMMVEITRENIGDTEASKIDSLLQSTFIGVLTLILPIIFSLIILLLVIMIWI